MLDRIIGAFAADEKLGIVYDDDPNIMATDSCAAPDHPVMSRIWSERRAFGTFVVGLTPDSHRLAHQAADQIQFYRQTRNRLRLLRNHLRRLVGRR